MSAQVANAIIGELNDAEEVEDLEDDDLEVMDAAVGPEGTSATTTHSNYLR